MRLNVSTVWVSDPCERCIYMHSHHMHPDRSPAPKNTSQPNDPSPSTKWRDTVDQQVSHQAVFTTNFAPGAKRAAVLSDAAPLPASCTADHPPASSCGGSGGSASATPLTAPSAAAGSACDGSSPSMAPPSLGLRIIRPYEACPSSWNQPTTLQLCQASARVRPHTRYIHRSCATTHKVHS